MKWYRLLAAAGLLALPLVSRADIAIQSTRLIHHAGERMVAQRVWNQGDAPSMIQAWIDSGNRDEPLEAGHLPFFVTPPLFQLEPGRNRDISVRLVDAKALPGDRESLYWLNVLDLPAAERAADTMNIAYAVRWRVKLFHRPGGLRGSPDEAASQLAWRLQNGGAATTHLRAHNSTPYHVSLRELSVEGAPLELLPDRAVIAPFSDWSIELPPGIGRRPVAVNVVWLDDQAQEHTLEATAACASAGCAAP